MGWLKDEMRRHRVECLDCGSPTEPGVYPEARGHAGRVEFVLRDVPVRRCSAVPGHRLFLLSMNYDVHLADALQQSDLEMARNGLSGTNCCFCGASLDGDGTGVMTTRAIVDVGKYGAVDVEITGPAITCEACGRDQIFNSYEPEADLNSAYSACFDEMPLIPY